MRLSLLVLCITMVGCGDTPTEPRRTVPTPIPTPLADLNGAWTGTLSFGTDYAKSCASLEQVGLTLVQSGSAVTGRLPTACEGVLDFRGTLESWHSLTADLVRSDGRSIGVLKGQIDSTSIHLENRDGDPWGYGDPTIGLDLTR